MSNKTKIPRKVIKRDSNSSNYFFNMKYLCNSFFQFLLNSCDSFDTPQGKILEDENKELNFLLVSGNLCIVCIDGDIC